MMMKRENNKELKIALFIFVFGFGVMNVLWVCCLLKGNIIRPGLYDYYAATIGDGICLPVMTYSGLRYVNKCQSVRNIYIELITGIISFLFSVGVQISWLLDDKIQTNWTIPKAHCFNLAGWYHAFFFVFMIIFVANLIVRMYNIHNVDRCKKTGKRNLLMYTIFWMSTSLFLYMHSIDDYVKSYGLFKAFFPIFVLSLILSILLWIKCTKTINTNIVIICLGQVMAIFLATLVYYILPVV